MVLLPQGGHGGGLGHGPPLKRPVCCRHPVGSQDHSQLPGHGPAHGVRAQGRWGRGCGEAQEGGLVRSSPRAGRQPADHPPPPSVSIRILPLPPGEQTGGSNAGTGVLRLIEIFMHGKHLARSRCPANIRVSSWAVCLSSRHSEPHNGERSSPSCGVTYSEAGRSQAVPLSKKSIPSLQPKPGPRGRGRPMRQVTGRACARDDG